MPDMEKQPFDFMGLRKIASALSIVLVVASIALAAVAAVVKCGHSAGARGS